MAEQQEKKMKLDEDDNLTFQLSCKYRVPYLDFPGHCFHHTTGQQLPFPPGELPVSSHCVVAEDRNSLTFTLQHGARCATGGNGTYEDAILAVLRDWLLWQLEALDSNKEDTHSIQNILEQAIRRCVALPENRYKVDCSVLVPYKPENYIPYDPKDPRGLPFPKGPLPYSKHCIVSDERNSFTITLKPWSAGEEVEGAYIEVLAAVVRDLLMFKNQHGSPLCCREFSSAISDVEKLILCLSDIKLFAQNAASFKEEVSEALRLIKSALYWLTRRAAVLQAQNTHGKPK